MLVIQLKVNHRTIKVIGAHNISPGVTQDFEGECEYNIHYGPKIIGKVKHERKNPVEELAIKALQKVLEYLENRPNLFADGEKYVII